MPREKAAPQKRSVHRFHDAASGTERDAEASTYLDDEIDCDEYIDEQNLFESSGSRKSNIRIDVSDRPSSFGRWRIEPNEIDVISSFKLTNSFTTGTSERRAIISTFKIRMRLHDSALEDLRKVEQLGLFCRGQHLVIESSSGPSLEGFSCNSLQPLSFVRALKKDVNNGALHLNIVGYDAEGFTIDASVNLFESTETILSTPVVQWLMSSRSCAQTGNPDDLFFQPSRSGRSRSGSVSDSGVGCGSPSWSLRTKSEFDPESFLNTAAFSARHESSSSTVELSSLIRELREGGLTTPLRPYQLQGVQWLFERLDCSSPTEPVSSASTTADGRFDGWVPLCTGEAYSCSSSGSSSNSSSKVCALWYNLITGQVADHLPILPPSSARSAILADEMGIGKSIQVLSLISLMKQRRLALLGLKTSLNTKGHREEEEESIAVQTQDHDHVFPAEDCTTDFDALQPAQSDDVSDVLTTLVPVPPGGEGNDEGDDLLAVTPRKRKRQQQQRSKTAATIHRAMAAEKIRKINLSDYPCLCGRRSEKKGDLGWVQCGVCARWLHVKCCGFSSAVEASSAINFECLACSCVRYGGAASMTSSQGCRQVECNTGTECDTDGRIKSSATLVLMPGTLITQWKGEILKHFSSSLTLGLSEATPLPGVTADSMTDLKDSSRPTVDMCSEGDSDRHRAGTAPALRLFVYEGCDEVTLKRRGLSFSDVDPRHLATKYDVIFMSLKVLTKHFHEAQSATGGERNTSRVTRRESACPSDRGTDWGNKMYVSFPPPFMCVRFSMVVVDETQKIESEGVTQGLMLCTSIVADRRLCVTGTPLGRNRLSDLHCLCQFLHLPPYGQLGKREWQCVFGDQSLLADQRVRNRWLSDLFAPVILRRTKSMVEEQLGLRANLVTVKMLVFSAFEVTSPSFLVYFLHLQRHVLCKYLRNLVIYAAL
jgi:SNF2-related domain